MNISEFHNEKLEKEMLAIIKFFYKFYINKLKDYQRNAISEYRNSYKLNNFLLGKDKSLDLLYGYGYTQEKSKIIDEILKNHYRTIFYINELDNLFRIIPAYNKNITTYRGLHICNRYPIEPNLKNMIYKLERSKIGEEFIFSTFLSTSLDQYVAFYRFAVPDWKNYDKKNNKEYLNKPKMTCDDLFELFGQKYFLVMKINIPKGNKFLYLDIFPTYGDIDNKIKIWENEILLPRNSKLKLVKRYDQNMKMLKVDEYSANKILHNKVKHENLPFRIYEFDYIGYEDTKEKIKLDVFLDFNQNKTYLKEIEKQVEDEIIKKPTKKEKNIKKSKKGATKKNDS